jgi:hypothetical protein
MITHGQDEAHKHFKINDKELLPIVMEMLSAVKLNDNPVV